jgi:dipeptidase
MKNFVLIIIFTTAFYLSFYAQDKPDWTAGFPDACTSITVGKKASVDGSVITSHTDDSHRTQSSINIVPPMDHPENSVCIMYKRVSCDSTIMPSYKNIKVGEIPQVAHTFGFINTAYPCMNEFQLGIGESTFGGRDELQSDSGLIDCQRLIQLMLERTTTARQAIKLADDLTKLYGYNDYGECLTIADKNEVWHFEIVGPGKGKKGAVWAAQRVPDDHVSVNANASTIKKINLKDKEHFMASANIFEVSQQNGWWDPKKEAFVFNAVYAPESRTTFASRRREWRVFDLLAPSLKLDPNTQDFPFSVKPDSLVSLQKLVDIFKDYYEGTPYDMTRNITTTDKNGKTIVSPLANPFMPYDQLGLHNVNGDWFHVDKKTNHIDFLGERTIARWYTMYGTIIQCRSWLPDEIGGLVWLALDNIATSIYIPVYCSALDLPETYKTDGRITGFSEKSAWWAFNRLGTLTAQRWGDMRHDVDSVWIPKQKFLFDDQSRLEADAIDIKTKTERAKYLTKYTMKWANDVVEEAWKLGDFLWTKYDEKF